VCSITSDALQRHVESRAQQTSKFRRQISHTTIRKEIGTLASVWNKWGVPQGPVAGPVPTKGLIYNKGNSKSPFQTWEHIAQARTFVVCWPEASVKSYAAGTSSGTPSQATALRRGWSSG
jgi:hypothetical protein